MKTIIAGSRTIPLTTFDSLMSKIVEGFPFKITEIICGGAKGPDLYGRDWAVRHNINVKMFSANWGRWGRAAGIYRNCEMGDYADCAIIFWDGQSKGTQHMINYLNKLNKPYWLEITK